MTDPSTWIGAVLVGGASRRMGTDKAALTLASGRTMLDHIVEVLRSRLDRVVLLGRTTLRPDLQQLQDDRPGAGPLAGLETLLASIDEDTRCILAPCDMPALDGAVIDALMPPDDADAVITLLRCEPETRAQMLPLAVDRRALPTITAMLDDPGEPHSIWRLTERVTTSIIDVPASLRSRFHNVNSPDDVPHD